MEGSREKLRHVPVVDLEGDLKDVDAFDLPGLGIEAAHSWGTVEK
jgi:hypothetical protein